MLDKTQNTKNQTLDEFGFLRIHHLYHFYIFYQTKFKVSFKPILSGRCNDRAGSFGKEIPRLWLLVPGFGSTARLVTGFF